MSCSALTAICLFMLIVALSSEINSADESTKPESDPFRLHRFRTGDQDIEKE